MRPLTGRREPPALHHEDWPARSGKTRVLIENPDRADLWAHAGVLRDAGYDVATCSGPAAPGEQQQQTACPLLTEGHCPLVDGADVVVSTVQLQDGREILAALSARATPALVVEGTRSELQREREAVGHAVELTLPVLPQQIVEAVERAHRSAS